jgi:hypothetical protein
VICKLTSNQNKITRLNYNKLNLQKKCITLVSTSFVGKITERKCEGVRILPFKSTSVEIACVFFCTRYSNQIEYGIFGSNSQKFKRWLASNHLETIVKDVEKVKLRGFHIYGIAFSDPFF